MALKVVVFGPAGDVGTVAVESALLAGHQVTAFIHQTPLPDHLTDKVTVVKGDVYNTDEVSSAIQGCDGVLVALGRGSDFSATTLFSDGTRNIVAGMKEHGVKRIVICNSSFIFYERIPLMFRLLGLEPIAEDHKRQVAVLREIASELDWIVVCPPRITGAAFTGAYEVVEDQAPSSSK